MYQKLIMHFCPVLHLVFESTSKLIQTIWTSIKIVLVLRLIISKLSKNIKSVHCMIMYFYCKIFFRVILSTTLFEKRFTIYIYQLVHLSYHIVIFFAFVTMMLFQYITITMLFIRQYNLTIIEISLDFFKPIKLLSILNK